MSGASSPAATGFARLLARAGRCSSAAPTSSSLAPRRAARGRALRARGHRGERRRSSRGDLRDAELVDRALGEHEVDSVFHLAAQTIVGTANRSPVPDLRDQHPRHLAAARGLPRRRASSASSSPPPTRPTGPTTSCPTPRTCRCSRRFPYDVSQGRDRPDRALLLAHLRRCRSRSTRFANLYGGGDRTSRGLIPEAVSAVLDGRPPVIRSDGSPERDFLYVEDAAAAYLAIADALDGRRRRAARRSTPAAARRTRCARWSS